MSDSWRAYASPGRSRKAWGVLEASLWAGSIPPPMGTRLCWTKGARSPSIRRVSEGKASEGNLTEYVLFFERASCLSLLKSLRRPSLGAVRFVPTLSVLLAQHLLSPGNGQYLLLLMAAVFLFRPCLSGSVWLTPNKEHMQAGP